MSQIAWTLGSIVGIGALLGVGALMGRRRRDALAAYAASHGMVFIEECPDKLALIQSRFPMLCDGHEQSCDWELRGTRNGVEFSAFQYQYTVGGGKTAHTSWHSMILWKKEDAVWPAFVVTPESWWDRLKQRFGTQDFDFPEDEAFSKSYQLQGVDEAAVRSLFDATKRAFFAGRPAQYLAGVGPYLLWWQPDSFPGPEQVDRFINDGDEVRRLFFT